MELDDFSIADSRTGRPRSWFFSPSRAKQRVLSSPTGGVRSEMLIPTSCLGCVGTIQPGTFCWCICLDWLLGRLHLALGSSRGVYIFWLPVSLCWSLLHRHNASVHCPRRYKTVWKEVESNLFTSVTYPAWSRDLSPALQRDLCGQVGSCTCPAVHYFVNRDFSAIKAAWKKMQFWRG